VTVATGAGHGEEGKAIILVSIAMPTFFTAGSEASEADFGQLQRNVPDMTVEEVVAELSPILESVGFETAPYDGIGDPAYWMWYEQQDTSVGELLIVQGESWLMVMVLNQPADTALSTILEPLAKAALERLPPAFLVLPSG